MIVVKLLGGLGNQLFQYSLGWRLARRAGAELRFDLRDLKHYGRSVRDGTLREYGLDVFGIDVAEPTVADLGQYWLTHSNRHVRYLLASLRSRLPVRAHRVIIDRDGAFRPGVLAIEDDAYLDGYWQSERYFVDCADALRAQLEVRAPLNEAAMRRAAEIAACNAVCVHVRRTDFVGNPLHDVCDVHYFRRAVLYMQERYADARFFVFSDDIAWCRDHLDLGVPLVFVEEASAGWKASGHLKLMTSCRHFVISNSSFGWWAAWLAPYAGKSIVAPRIWLLDPRYDTRHVVPRSWTRL